MVLGRRSQKCQRRGLSTSDKTQMCIKALTFSFLSDKGKAACLQNRPLISHSFFGGTS